MDKHNIQDILQEKGQYVSTSAGVSMFPMLRNRRDTIIVRSLSRPLKKYDVPLYIREDDGAYVLHRIIGIGKNCYIIRGDNCINKEYIKKEQIIGVLEEFYRGSRHVKCDSAAFKVYSRFAVLIHPVQMLAVRVFRKIKSVLKKTKDR